MSGIKRAILAEATHKGVTGEQLQEMLSPENQLNEKGRSVHSPAASGADDGEYLGKNGVDANK